MGIKIKEDVMDARCNTNRELVIHIMKNPERKTLLNIRVDIWPILKLFLKI